MTVRRLLVVGALVAAAVAGGPLAARQWLAVPTDSRLEFTARQAGAPFQGAFETFETEIDFDPGNPGASRIVATIDMASVETGMSDRDATLAGAEWFATRTYPHARFATGDVRHVEGNAYEAVGQLTIRDVTRDVILPFTVEISGDRARAAGGLTIDRVDYGVGTGEWAKGDTVGRAVEIRFEIEARAPTARE